MDPQTTETNQRLSSVDHRLTVVEQDLAVLKAAVANVKQRYHGGMLIHTFLK